MDTDLDKLILKAKIELMTRSVFLSTISLRVKHIVSDKTAAAGTDGTSIWYNPEFIKKQSIPKLAGLIAHECWHIAFQHMSRLMDRDQIIWNVAGDHVINLMLTKAGFEIPDDGMLDTKYTDMSTDQVYDDLIKNKKDYDPSTLMLDLIPVDDSTEKGQEQKQKILDVIVKAHTQAKLSNDKEVGELPGEIARVIDNLLNPILPWPVLLNKFLDRRVNDEYSWSRRNRRYSVYLPSLYNHGLGHLTWAIDLSGSISDEELRDILSEIQGVKDTMCPERMTIIGCDCNINEVYEIDANTNILSLKFTGGGGTSFDPVMEYIEKHPTTALIYFTDLYAPIPKDPDIPVLWVCNSDREPMPFGETIYLKR